MGNEKLTLARSRIRINSFGFCQIHRSLERVLSEQIMILFSLFSLSIVSKFENDREYGLRIGLNSNATLCTVNHEYHWSTGSGTACFKAIAGKSARENLGYRPSGSFLPSYLRSIDYPRLGDQPIPAFSWHTTSLHFVRSMLLVHRTFALWNVSQIRSNSSPLFSFFFFFLSFFCLVKRYLNEFLFVEEQQDCCSFLPELPLALAKVFSMKRNFTLW